MSKQSSVGKRITNKENPKKTYTSRLQKGGALLEDMRFLVREWEEGSNDEQRQRLIVENVLGKKTRARASDVYTRAFSQRFIKGDPQEAWKILRPLEDREVDLEILRPVYYWITARSEPLLYDFVSEEIIARSGNLDLSVRVDETSQWIKNRLLIQDQTWTDTVALKVSRGLLAALRDFGILEGASKKKIAPVYLPVESFAYIAFNLHTLGNSSERLVTHPDWRLFLMQPFVVERLFLDAHQNRLLHYEAAGKIYRIEFPAKKVEEMADVIS